MTFVKLLTDQVALITGGTRGIGKAIAELYVEQGASVAVFGMNVERGTELLKALQERMSSNQKAGFYPVDVAHTAEVDQAVTQVYADFGRIDLLVNNAGVTADNLLMKLTEGEWNQVLDTNLKSLYNCCHAVVRAMLKARRGKIINISSVVGLMGNAGQTNYAASKAGMIGFSKSLAREVASRGICVNCIAPGFIETDMTRALTEQQRDALLATIPLQRFGKPEEIAHTALYLASHWANYVTGQVLTVDGGMVMA